MAEAEAQHSLGGPGALYAWGTLAGQLKLKWLQALVFLGLNWIGCKPECPGQVNGGKATESGRVLGCSAQEAPWQNGWI